MKVASVVGARPQFIKIAPLHSEISRIHHHIIVHTGQHYDYEMSQVFFEELSIPRPDYDLGVGSASHAVQTSRMLVALEQVLLKERPNLVLVFGDTNSTLAGALAAAKMCIPVVHVEAGLRSYRKDMPEELNRVLTDHVSSLLLCPSRLAAENLAREGITVGVHVVGDTMIQCLIDIQPRLDERVLQRYGLIKGEYVLATIHRQENADSQTRMKSIVDAILSHEGIVVLPLHPRTAKNLKAWNLLSDLELAKHVRILPPLNFMAFTVLERYVRVIMTDSGGVQKEAHFFGVPCVTIREETKWEETVAEGWNTLVGTDTVRILEALASPRPGKSRQTSYGDVDVAKRIVTCIEGMRIV
jgi:UDP-N-acetylglucosamine 2-epimerase